MIKQLLPRGLLGRSLLIVLVPLVLLQALARKPGEVLSREEIVDTLQMDEAGERAIDVQVTRLRRKIEADPARPQVLVTVRGIGYRYEARV